jgi:GT2 family glycosyltransferase
MSFPGLAIIIINYNRPNDTIECLESFLNAGAVLEQVIVVDNGSNDNSTEIMLRKYGTALDLVKAGEALGLPNGRNLGIRRALQKDPTWLLLMTNDTTVAPDFLEELEKAATSQERYAIISPLIVYYFRPEKIWFLADWKVPGTLITINRHRGKSSLRLFPPLVESSYFTGCSLLIRRDVFERAGLFDTSFFMYGEEVDFIHRARLLGYRCAAAGRARLFHKVSVTLGKPSPWSRRARAQNQVRVYRRYSRGLALCVMFLFTLFRTLILSVADLARGRFNLLAPTWDGWLSGWTARQV